MLLEIRDETCQRIDGPVHEQVVAQLSFHVGDLGVWGDMGRVDYCCIEPCLNCMMKKDAVQGGTRMRRDTERHIADAQNRQNTRKCSLDLLDRLQRLKGTVSQVFLTSCHRET